jgi:DUF4097 and DUF4098 domain-containing protein YvlB
LVKVRNGFAVFAVFAKVAKPPLIFSVMPSNVQGVPSRHTTIFFRKELHMRPIAMLAAILIAAPMVAQKITIQPSGLAAATETKTFPLRSGGKLKISNRNGDIKVTAWDSDEVALTANFKPNSNDDHAWIEANSGNGSLEFIVKHPEGRNIRRSASCEMELKVPRRLTFDVNSRNGTVSLQAVTGTIAVETRNGSIVLDNVSGGVNAATRNGEVSGQVQNLGENIDMSTRNGSIDVKLLNPSGTLLAASRNGRIKLETPGAQNQRITGNTVRANFAEGKGNINLNTRNGSIVVK